MSSVQNKLTGKDIREKFIEFFQEKHSHKVVKSSSLIPDNPTVLLTPAGMLQFVPIFLGYEQPPTPPRAVSVQKCARAGGKDSDIENVGRTPRHHTFFEMLGNFSFGDYFKEEIIPWSWDFITNWLNLDVDRLWITVFETDDEAAQIWEKTGISKDRILRKGKKDNFWGPPGPTGPCGPCSEIHYDLGKEYACSDDCGIDTCECDRWVEIWNLVFMELNQDEDGNQTPLAKKNVDTGMGLERIAMVVNGKTSTFETDLLMPILEKVCDMSGKEYNTDKKTDISLRIITDHIRCVTFMISDGLVPGNEGRNYVLRMILRRALRHGKIMGMELPFIYKLVDIVVDNYKTAYPELAENKDRIINIIKKEEERFAQTLGKGEGLLEEVISKADSKTISGEDAFKLYDTFGFPLELTIEMAEEKGFNIDIDGFNKAMQEQKERAKQAHKKVKLTDDLVYVETLKQVGAAEFVGYDQTEVDNAKVLTILKNNETVDEATDGDEIEIVLNKTPFYAESGGQAGDTGTIKSVNCELEVLDTQKFDTLFVHRCKVNAGSIKTNEIVTATVNKARRKEIIIHHTTAHLLQSALKTVLGDTVAQAGSQVDENRTRFDFSFDRALTKEEIDKVENLLNKWISDDIERTSTEMTMDEAKSCGAIALFDEKYGDKVRVVSVGEVSKELCGGIHINKTSEIRLAKVISESAIASGVRRIEVLCGNTAMTYLNEHKQELDKIAQTFKAPITEAVAKVEKLIEDNKAHQKRIKELEAEVAQSKLANLIDNTIEIEGGKLLIEKVEGLTPDILKASVEKMSDKLGNSIVLLASVFGDKISIIAKVSDNFIKNGIKAGQLVNDVASKCDGRGGGKPNFAQAGAKDASKLDEALQIIKQQLS